MVDIRIPHQFKSSTAGQSRISLPGETIQEVFHALCAAYPTLNVKLFDNRGIKRKTVNVYHNKEDIRYKSGLDTPVVDGDEIIILPPASGG